MSAARGAPPKKVLTSSGWPGLQAAPLRSSARLASICATAAQLQGQGAAGQQGTTG